MNKGSAKDLASLSLSGSRGMSGVFKATNHKHGSSLSLYTAGSLQTVSVVRLPSQPLFLKLQIKNQVERKC